jgi:hypothetical protein
MIDPQARLSDLRGRSIDAESIDTTIQALSDRIRADTLIRQSPRGHS